MRQYQLPYGHTQLTLHLPEGVPVEWIEPGYVSPAPDPLDVVREALRCPVDGRTLAHYGGARSVAIAINDKTRPVPHEHLLPPLLDALHAEQIPAEAITFYIATGTHLPMPADEFERVLPAEIVRRYRVVSHNCDDPQGLIELGTTSRGTPVIANRAYQAADLRIVVGNIEPHHFAGFSGGYKTAAIGLAGRSTINYNHVMLIEPEARIAEVERNPLRQDIEEIGDAMGVQFALNAILNGDKKIVRAVSGHPRAVMQAGVPISQEVCQVRVGGGPDATRRYDIVVASVGGAPKDINFYQSQKALTHASLFTRDGGAIILAAECPEGSGSRAYEAFMEGLTSTEQVFARFRERGFQVGPHKAFQVARDAARVHIILVSEIPAALVNGLLMSPAANLQQAYQQALARIAPDLRDTARVAILPRATNTVPVFDRSS